MKIQVIHLFHNSLSAKLIILIACLICAWSTVCKILSFVTEREKQRFCYLLLTSKRNMFKETIILKNLKQKWHSWNHYFWICVSWLFAHFNQYDPALSLKAFYHNYKTGITFTRQTIIQNSHVHNLIPETIESGKRFHKFKQKIQNQN